MNIYCDPVDLLFTNIQDHQTMTNIGDVIRQIELIRSDSQYPLTSEQKETVDRILCKVSSGSADYPGSR
jgi:hypothetical protein